MLRDGQPSALGTKRVGTQVTTLECSSLLIRKWTGHSVCWEGFYQNFTSVQPAFTPPLLIAGPAHIDITAQRTDMSVIRASDSSYFNVINSLLDDGGSGSDNDCNNDNYGSYNDYDGGSSDCDDDDSNDDDDDDDDDDGGDGREYEKLMVGELLMDFQDIAFLPSIASFYNTFL